MLWTYEWSTRTGTLDGILARSLVAGVPERVATAATG
jgi:hypothetical protein